MADAAAMSDADKADSYIGSLISLITQSEIRYEGFMFHLDSKECTIGLRNVKAFGTEGRRKDGPQVSPSQMLYDYVLFRGTDIKDLQVLSAPSAQSTSAIPDDPAIIQPRHPHLSAATISLVSPSAFQATNLNSNTQSGVQAPPFQGNLLPNQSVEVSISWASMVSAPHVNVSGPPLANYSPGFTGLPEGTSRIQRPFPPPPPLQGPVVTNHTQQEPIQHLSKNACLARSESNITEAPRPLLPPFTGTMTLISTLPPASHVQSSNVLLTPSFSNLALHSVENKASGSFPTATANLYSRVLSSSATNSDENPVVPPVTQIGQSLLSPLPLPIIHKVVSSTVGISSASDGKILITSHASVQPGLVESSSSHYLKDGNDDAKIIVASISDSESSDSEDIEAAPQLPETLNIKIHEPASSSYSVNRRHMQNRGDGMHQSNRGRAQGRVGRGNLPNRAYQSYRGYSVERRNAIAGSPLHPHHLSAVRGHAPNPTWYPRRNLGGHAHEGGSKISRSVTRFTEDFDFEAMNRRFNKEEVWGLLGRSKSGEEVKEGDDKEGNLTDAKDEAGDELPKIEQPIYFKDDFFDSISCRSLDAQSGKGKMKISEQRRIDAETFGEISKPRQNRGGMGPPQGGWSSQGFHRGRGSGVLGRGGGVATYRNRMT